MDKDNEDTAPKQEPFYNRKFSDLRVRDIWTIIALITGIGVGTPIGFGAFGNNGINSIDDKTLVQIAETKTLAQDNLDAINKTSKLGRSNNQAILKLDADLTTLAENMSKFVALSSKLNDQVIRHDEKMKSLDSDLQRIRISYDRLRDAIPK